MPPLPLALFSQLFMERSLACSFSLVLSCWVTLSESLPLSGPQLSLKLSPTLKFLILQKNLGLAGLLRPLSRDNLELTEPSFFIHGWNELIYVIESLLFF